MDLMAVLLAGKCHDLRDLCYGIQGLLVEEFKTDIDYMKSKEDVFVDMTVVLLRSTTDATIVRSICSLGLAMEMYHTVGHALLTRLREVHRQCHREMSVAALRENIMRTIWQNTNTVNNRTE